METTPLSATFDGRKEFRSSKPLRDRFRKGPSIRIGQARKHNIVQYLQRYHDRSPWRMFESGDAWFVEGSAAIVACVFAYEQGFKAAKSGE